MTNILGDEKRQDVLALGRLGWTLPRIQKATGVRRETASAYLQAAGIAIRAPRHNPLARGSKPPAASKQIERLRLHRVSNPKLAGRSIL